jgi:hypothetical protein
MRSGSAERKRFLGLSRKGAITTGHARFSSDNYLERK